MIQENKPRVVHVMQARINQDFGTINQSVAMCIEDHSGSSRFDGLAEKFVEYSAYEAEREKVRKLVEALSVASAALNDISEFNNSFHNDSDINQMVGYAKKKIKEIEEA